MWASCKVQRRRRHGETPPENMSASMANTSKMSPVPSAPVSSSTVVVAAGGDAVCSHGEARSRRRSGLRRMAAWRLGVARREVQRSLLVVAGDGDRAPAHDRMGVVAGA